MLQSMNVQYDSLREYIREQTFLILQALFLETIWGVNVEESPNNGLELFIEVFIIGIGGGVCQKTRPVDRMFNAQVKILSLPCQGIVLIVVHWGFHYNITIWVKVLCSIILMVLLIRMIGRWCFYGTCRGCLNLRYLLTNL